ncbi:phosphate regulon sensor histidine kinase PhoR [Gilvimarinus sp. F26214L]|uniref:phosphate regulon sensor histidine kinase PhoR n=1 Tax=Gilvimarinus sp. DZF01 TaxID=3461371 RepID=UPI004045CEBF
MYRGFAAEIRRVLIITIVCIGFGLLNGYLSWTLIAGGALYMAWTLWQIYRLERWIREREPGLPPDASGFWGEVFDRLYHLQKRREKEKARLKATLDWVQEATAALPDAAIVLDKRGNMNWWNEAATELLAFEPGDRHQALLNFIRNPQFVAYFEAGNYREPITIPSPQDDARRLQFQITRYGQDERLVMIRDVTRLHRLEQVRRDFVANVSHELRTPLTVLKGYLETLADQAPDVAPQWEKALTPMQQQSERMSLLVNDLITLSRLETEEPEKEQTLISVATLLRTIKDEALAIGGDSYVIKLDADQNVAIRGREKELHSAISNLVVNAINYSPPGTVVSLRVYRDDRGLHIAVSDNGVGIDPVHLPRLTERFYRVDSGRTAKSGGTGLGLAIVKHVLLRHDGKLSIESSPGKGSTFTCSFPLSRVRAEGDRQHLDLPG